MSKVVCILGMHRSGTSLSASILNRSGLDLGERLLPGDESNPAGHFEDLDFLNLHKDILEHNNLSPYTASMPQPHYTSDHRNRAKTLLEERNTKTVWGWKDPRTCLLLPFWLSLLADETLIPVIVLRNPHDTVQSLMAREHFIRMSYRHKYELPLLPFRKLSFMSNARSLASRFYLSWITHYSMVRTNIVQAGMPFFCIEFENLLTTDWIDALNSRFELNLKPVYIPSQRASYQRKQVNYRIASSISEEVNELYNYFKKYTHIP